MPMSRPTIDPLTCAGHHFLSNGDLQIAYHQRRSNLLLYKVFGFRNGVKVLVDSWCEPSCPECRCPRERYHAYRCKRGSKNEPAD